MKKGKKVAASPSGEVTTDPATDPITGPSDPVSSRQSLPESSSGISYMIQAAEVYTPEEFHETLQQHQTSTAPTASSEQDQNKNRLTQAPKRRSTRTIQQFSPANVRSLCLWPLRWRESWASGCRRTSSCMIGVVHYTRTLHGRPLSYRRRPPPLTHL